MRVPIAAILAAASIVVAASACNSTAPVPTPAPTPTSPETGPALQTVVPIGATPWPNGTLGKYGLRIDPNLAGHLPSYVGGNPLQEDAGAELLALDNSQFADSFTSYYVAHIGEITDLNWLDVSVGLVKDDAVGDEFYASWRDAWFKTSCAQADGVAATSQEEINGFTVDLATCAGGARAYTLSPGNGILVSLIDLGPRRLGRELIQAMS